MSDQVIFIGVISAESHERGWREDAAISEIFGSVEKVIEYLEKLKQEGNKSPKDLESCFGR